MSRVHPKVGNLPNSNFHHSGVVSPEHPLVPLSIEEGLLVSVDEYLVGLVLSEKSIETLYVIRVYVFLLLFHNVNITLVCLKVRVLSEPKNT